jgi:hypothetical protein
MRRSIEAMAFSWGNASAEFRLARAGRRAVFGRVTAIDITGHLASDISSDWGFRLFARFSFLSAVHLLAKATVGWFNAVPGRARPAPPAKGPCMPSPTAAPVRHVRDDAFDAKAGSMDSRGCWSVSRRGQLIEAGFGLGTHFPQYLALHAESGFLRLNGGPGSDWGSSVALLPPLWEAGRYAQGGPVSVTWKSFGSTSILSFSGRMSSLRVHGELHLREPGFEGFACDVFMSVAGDIRLDCRPGEAFKPVFASSMHVGDDRWDVESVCVDARRYTMPERGWIVEPVVQGRRMVLNGGASRWKRRATSVEIELDERMIIAAWKSPSSDPNDDNVGVWAAADHVPRDWHYVMTARI